MAFSNDFLVTISLGLMSFSISKRIAFPAATHSSIFSGLTAGFEELYGNESPRTSMAEAMVFAVYIPPQAPAPGHAL